MCSNDEMIQYLYIEIITSIFQLFSQIHILDRWAQTPGRMIVSYYDVTRISIQRRLKNHFGMHTRSSHSSATDLFLTQYIISAIQQKNPKFFMIEIFQKRTYIIIHLSAGRKALPFRYFRFLPPPAQLHRSYNRYCLRYPDSFKSHEIVTS